MRSTHDHHASTSPARPSVAELTVGAALACTMAWVSMSFKSMGLFARYGHGESLLDTTYLVSIIAVSLTLLAASAFDRRTEALLEHRATRFVLPLGVAASTLLMPLAGIPGIAGASCGYAAGALSGMFSGLFLFEFGMAFSLMTTRSIVVGAATGSILSTLLFALFLLFQPFEACVFAASMPLIAGMLLASGMKGVQLVDQEPPPDASKSPRKTPRSMTSGAAS